MNLLGFRLRTSPAGLLKRLGRGLNPWVCCRIDHGAVLPTYSPKKRRSRMHRMAIAAD